MVSAYQGSVQKGQIKLASDARLPEGAQVIVVVVEPADTIGEVLTAKALASSDIVGIWKDREDIQDSSAHARELREQAQRRTRATS